jgi:hypothetical protein
VKLTILAEKLLADGFLAAANLTILANTIL